MGDKVMGTDVHAHHEQQQMSKNLTPPGGGKQADNSIGRVIAPRVVVREHVLYELRLDRAVRESRFLSPPSSSNKQIGQNINCRAKRTWCSTSSLVRSSGFNNCELCNKL